MSAVSPRQNPFVERPASKNGVALPMIKVPHPASRIDHPANINIRGVSRQSNNHFGDDIQLKSPNVLRPITADQLPFRSLKSPRHHSLPPLQEDFDSKLPIDKNKMSLPIDGKNADNLSPRGSRPATSTTIATGRVSTDELERILKEKAKSDYFTIKNAFKSFDPEGKGNIDRESLMKIISDFLSVVISLSQFNRLMTRFHLEKKKIISFGEFYACIKPTPNENGEYPTWFDIHKRGNDTMIAPQVLMHLKEKAKQRVLDVAALIPQKNPGGTRRILKPEFRNAISSLGFHMQDEEFDKLWARFDTENIGAVNGEKIMTKLGIVLSDEHHQRTRTSSEDRRSASPQEVKNERETVDLAKWITNKFREGAREMTHAFYEMDLERKGTISKTQLKRVLTEYSIDLDDEQLIQLLERCDLPTQGPIDYKQFIKRFQDRSDVGMTHKILNDPNHAYNIDVEHRNESTKETYLAESKLMDLFQKEFLSLLGSFHKIDRSNSMVISEKQFRAVIESRFKVDLSEESFKKLMEKVPLDENGMVKYVEFMSTFDSREAKSLFDAKSTVADLRDIQEVAIALTPQPPREEKSRVQSRDSYNSQEGRSIEELTELIKDVMKNNYQKIEQEFRDMDEFNAQKLSPEMMVKLLKGFGVSLSKNEIKRLWDAMITDQRGNLEFMQFVRHFTFRLRSAAFPNSKVSPPKRGDSDFKLRSKKLNSAYDMLQDSLRSKVDQHCEALNKHFHELDPSSSGFVSKEKFKNVLQSLCIHLTDFECDLLSSKFDVKKDGSVCWVEFLKPFSMRRQIYRKGNNMVNILTHPDQKEAKTSPRSPKGLASVALKVHNRFAGDTKQLQRAFRKIDASNSGWLTIQEFGLVLQLCDVILNDEESFQLFTELDKAMSGRVNYNEFLNKLNTT